MRVLTWNIMHPDYNVSEFDWEYRKAIIINTLLESKADVICLQEFDSANMFELPSYNLYYQNDKTRTKKLKQWLASDKKAENKPNTLVCVIFVRDGLKVTDISIGSRSLSITIDDEKKD